MTDLPELLGAAQHDAIVAAYRYWSQLRRRHGVALPGRQHLDPVDMAAFLPHVILFDVERRDGKYRFRHRLTGTHFAEIFGREVTGLYIEESGSLETFDAVYRRFATMVDDKVMIYGVAPAPVRDKDFVQYEHLTFPLASDGRTVDMLFGVRCILPGKSQRENAYATLSVLAADTKV